MWTAEMWLGAQLRQEKAKGSPTTEGHVQPSSSPGTLPYCSLTRAQWRAALRGGCAALTRPGQDDSGFLEIQQMEQIEAGSRQGV